VAWEAEADRALLLELYLNGLARRRRAQAGLLTHLESLRWLAVTPRRAEVALVPDHREDLRRMLDGAWPDWMSIAQALQAERLEPSQAGLKELRRRQRDVPPIPARVNIRTATAQVGEHSKATLGQAHREMLGDAEVVRDGVVLIRPSSGLSLDLGDTTWTATDLQRLQGLVALTQRALLDGTRLSGSPPAVVMTVENEGAFIDLDKPDAMMLVWVPGWNTRLALEVLDQVRARRWLHFGDLDPNGVRIFRHLSEQLPRLEHFIPDWWADRVAEAPQLGAAWNAGVVSHDDHPLLRQLEAAGQASEQEIVVLDPRMAGSLAAIVGDRL
jgi:hypothetical protein